MRRKGSQLHPFEILHLVHQQQGPDPEIHACLAQVDDQLSEVELQVARVSSA